jgi:hypothetical protein
LRAADACGVDRVLGGKHAMPRSLHEAADDELELLR